MIRRLTALIPLFGFLLVGIISMAVTHKSNPHRRVREILKKEALSLDHITQGEVAKTVLSLSQRYELDPLLILAVMKVESNFRLTARSHRGALGLMQVKPIVVRDVADELAIEPAKSGKLLSDFHFNLKVGVHYLASLVDRFDGDLTKALMAYNRGPTAVAREYRNRPVPHSGYQKKVLDTYEDFASL